MRIRRAVRRFARFFRHERGSVAIELAFVTPLLVSLLLSGVEFGHYVLLHQKLERTTSTIADLIAQSENLTEGGIQGIFTATKYVMKPYDLSADGTLVVSSVSAKDGSGAVIRWQRSLDGSNRGSRFGNTGEIAKLPEGFSVGDGENVIICEATFDYEPMVLPGLFPEGELYRYSMFRPRFQVLDTVAP